MKQLNKHHLSSLMYKKHTIMKNKTIKSSKKQFLNSFDKRKKKILSIILLINNVKTTLKYKVKVK